MQLTFSEMRILIDALEFKLAHLQAEQDRLDHTQQERIAEISNDMYQLELLLDCLKAEYKQWLKKIEEAYKPVMGEVQPEDMFMSAKKEVILSRS